MKFLNKFFKEMDNSNYSPVTKKYYFEYVK